MVSRAIRRKRVVPLVPALIGIIAIASAAVATPPPNLVGDWSGSLVAGGQTLRLVLHVTAESAGKLKVSLDSVDQGAMGLPGDKAILNGSNFSFEIPSVHGNYHAAIAPGGNSMNGTWSQGVPLPLEFTRTTPAAEPTPEATPTPMAARPPLPARELKSVLEKELAPALAHGLLSPPTHGGMVIGVLDHGKRQIFSYGTARPDSIFEIGSITKTFTGLTLAQMVVQQKVKLDEPVGDLLAAGFVNKPNGPEITLLDLATQHSGLPRMPDNFESENPQNPYADYGPAQLSEFLKKRGVEKPAAPKFLYSNLGFGLLGYALSNRAGVSYGQLVRQEIIEPLKLHDTAATLSPAQRPRLIQGYGESFDPARAWDFDALAGAGAIKSDAADMLTYLDANLHPGKYAAGAAPGSPAAALPAAVALDHQPRADAGKDTKIALAWFIDPKTHSYLHNGGTHGYGAFAAFNPGQDWGVVVLYNRGGPFPRFVDRVGENIAALLAGQPAPSLDYLCNADRQALAHPDFDLGSIKGAYRCRLTAFTLPATAEGAFTPTGTGDIHVVADGKGRFTSGTWVHRIDTANLHMTCKLDLASGSYTVEHNGTGVESTKWKLRIAESPRTCFRFFSPDLMSVTTAAESIMTDKGGRIFYSTSINPFALLSVVCEREEKK
jgi:serine-type D-Ala-D-Ala carboxypeptidase/endopeptidase